jgi:hypothetical protein
MARIAASIWQGDFKCSAQVRHTGHPTFSQSETCLFEPVWILYTVVLIAADIVQSSQETQWWPISPGYQF